MNPHLYISLLLLVQPAEEVRFRKLEQGSIEVVARLGSAGNIPQGRLTTEIGPRWLRLCVVDPKTGKPGPPMLGSYERRGQDLVFRPRFAPEPERLYRAYFGLAAGPAVTADYRVARVLGKDPP